MARSTAPHRNIEPPPRWVLSYEQAKHELIEKRPELPEEQHLSLC